MVLERKTMVVPRCGDIRGEGFWENLLKEEGFVSYLGFPLISKDKVLGVLELYCRKLFRPDKEWMHFMEAISQQLAIAIENAILTEQLHHSREKLISAYDATIEGWAKALELRDRETEGHSQRATEMTLRLARQLNVPEEELVHIRRGALLHDIGKMAIPHSILLKSGPLTPEEWEIMKPHPVYAYEMLSPIPLLKTRPGHPSISP